MFNPSDLEYGPSGFPIMWAVTPLILDGSYATRAEVSAGLARYEQRVPTSAHGPEVLLVGAPIAALDAEDIWESGDFEASVKADAWHLGPPVTIQPTHAAARWWIEQHDSNHDNDMTEDDHTCVTCGLDIVLVAVPFDTSPGAMCGVDDDGVTIWAPDCESALTELRRSLDISLPRIE